MSSTVKNVLEENVKSTVNNLVSGYSTQLSSWLRENKNVDVSPEEVCKAFEIPYKAPPTPSSGLPSGANIQTCMPSLPDYYSGVTTPKKRGGRTKKVVDPNLPTCAYEMTRGKSAGQRCSNQVVGDGVTLGGDRYCKQCLKKAAVKTLLNESSTKATLQGPVLDGNSVDVPENTNQEKDELQVVAIPEEEGLYRETNHGFIVQSDADGNVTAIAIDDNGTRREMREDERKIAEGMGLRVVNNDTVPTPTVVETTSAVPQVPVVPQIPGTQTLTINKS